MKKIIGLLLAVVLCVSVCACGETQNKNKTVLKTKNISVEKVIADDSYRDDDGSPRRALYVFFNLHPESENIEFDCKLDMKINDTNEYTSEILPGTLCKYVPSYYYGGYLETVYGGYTQKFVATFLVPEGDLSEGKKIIFTDSDINDIDDIILFTDEIIHVNGDMEVGKIADPEGCAKI